MILQRPFEPSHVHNTGRTGVAFGEGKYHRYSQSLRNCHVATGCDEIWPEMLDA